MFELLFEPAKKFITIVGSIVGGIVALFAASGFLAETMLASVLGISEIRIGYEQYVMTGAKFFLSVVGYLLLNFTFWGGVASMLFVIRLVGWLINRKLRNIKRTYFYRSLLSVLQLGFFFATIIFSFDFLKILNYRERDLLYFNKIPDIYLNNLCENNIQPDVVSDYQRLILITVMFLISIVVMEFLRRTLLKQMLIKDIGTNLPTDKSEKETSKALSATDPRKRLFKWHHIGFYVPYLIWLVVFFELLLLPFNFSGVLIVERRYPIVNVVFEDPELNTQFADDRNLTCVSSNEKEVFLYNPLDRRSRVINKDLLIEIKIVSKSNIFQLAPTDLRCK